MGFKHGIRCRLTDPFLFPPRYLYFTQMHAYADNSHSLLVPEITMSPDPESRLEFDHSSQALLLGQISPLGCFVRQLVSLSCRTLVEHEAVAPIWFAELPPGR
jgi:hypothetical protein